MPRQAFPWQKQTGPHCKESGPVAMSHIFVGRPGQEKISNQFDMPCIIISME